MRNTIYIAGKVTGLPAEEAKDKFYKMEETLKGAGYHVVNPVSLIIDLELHHKPWDDIMKVCIKRMLDCDAIHFLPCWQDSRGAVLERDIAIRLGMTVVYH